MDCIQGTSNQQPQPAQGPQGEQQPARPATTYATNVSVPYSKKFNFGLTLDANGDLVIDDPRDQELYPEQLDQVEEPVAAPVVAAEPILEQEENVVEEAAIPENDHNQEYQVEGEAPWFPRDELPMTPVYGQPGSEVYYGADGSLPGPSNAPQEYMEGGEHQEWQNESILEQSGQLLDWNPLPYPAPGQYEAPDQIPDGHIDGDYALEEVMEVEEDHEPEEDQPSGGELIVGDEEINRPEFGPMSYERTLNFPKFLIEGEEEVVEEGEDSEQEDMDMEEEEEVLEEVEEEEELEDMEEEEEEAEATRKIGELKKQAEEDKINQNVIREIQRKDELEDRRATLRNRGRPEDPQRKLTADQDKRGERLVKKHEEIKARGIQFRQFGKRESIDPEHPEYAELLRDIERLQKEERRMLTTYPDSESDSEDESYDPDESRRARRKQQVKRRKHDNEKRH